MRKNPVVLTVVFLVLSWFKISGQISNTEFNQMIANAKELEFSEITNWNSIYNNVNTYISKLDTVTPGQIGSWSIGSDSIPYSSRTQTTWPPINHLHRIREFVLAYINESSPYYQSAMLFDKIEKTIEFWYDKNPTSTNWWFQEIDAPQKLGRCLLLLRSGSNYISQDLENKILERMRGQASRMWWHTGANRSDVALHTLYRGILKKDQTIINDGLNAVKSTVFKDPVTSEGIQKDLSYFQHGLQLYTTGYAESSIIAIINSLYLIKNTQYGFSVLDRAYFFKFARESYLSHFRGRFYMYYGFGRAIANKGRLTNLNVLKIAKNLQLLDSENASVYTPVISRLSGTNPASFGVIEKLQHYWVADYTLYNSPNYNFDIRMASTRTCRVENGNNTNVKGYYLSEGGYSVLTNGDEYLDIFPVWDWSMIPGTTLPNKTEIPNPGEWQKLGNSIIAGGLSNGNVGITVYHMNNFEFNTNTTAKKSWFLFGNEIVCLGAGISSYANEAVNTTVNQCLLKNDLVVNENGTETSPAKGIRNWTGNNLKWIYHGNIGYIFPQSSNLSLSNQTQSGNWNHISPSYSVADSLKKDVFKLWLNHGVKPQNASYSYIIVPGKSLEEVRNYNLSDIEVLMNTDSVQVVYNRNKDLMGLVFNKAASFTDSNFKLATSGSCLILISNPFSNNIQGWVSDPQQVKDELKIFFKNDSFLQGKELFVKLPAGEDRGSTKEFDINQLTTDFIHNNTNLHKLYPTDDAFVRNGTHANNNYGSSTFLDIKNDAVDWRRDVLLKFDLSQIDTTTLVDANLVMTVQNAGVTVLSTNWSLYPTIGSSWSEGTLNWNNKPAYDSKAISVLSGSNAGSVMRFEGLKNIIESGIRSGENVLSLVVVGSLGFNGTYNASFYSKEATVVTLRPYIELENTSDITKVLNQKYFNDISFQNRIKMGQSSKLTFSTNSHSIGEISVYSFFGANLAKMSFNVYPGRNEVNVPVDMLNKGFYLLSVSLNKHTVNNSFKFVID